MSEPKFVKGEIVNVRSALLPEFNIDGMAVKKVRKIYGNCVESWGYELVDQPNTVDCYKEESLRKLPPNEKTEWEDCVWSPEMIKQLVS